MNENYVYLLKFKDKPYFKIGKAADCVRRAGVLSHWGKVDTSESRVYRTDDHTVDFESSLKRLFRRYAYPVPGPEQKDGYSELYQVDQWEKAVDQASSIKRLYGSQEMDPSLWTTASPCEKPDLPINTEKSGTTNFERAQKVMDKIRTQKEAFARDFPVYLKELEKLEIQAITVDSDNSTYALLSFRARIDKYELFLKSTKHNNCNATTQSCSNEENGILYVTSSLGVNVLAPGLPENCMSDEFTRLITAWREQSSISCDHLPLSEFTEKLFVRDKPMPKV